MPERSVGGLPFTTQTAESLLQLALPPGSKRETTVAVQRLIELTSVLARRCAQLQEALDSRIMIEQAKGVLAERFDVEPDVGFEALRRSARGSRVPLRDLAARVVSSRETPPEVLAQLHRAAAPTATSR